MFCCRIVFEHQTKIHKISHREYYQVTFAEWSVTDRDMVKQRTAITRNILLVSLGVDLFSFSDLLYSVDVQIL